MSYLVLARKYRPVSFDEIVGQEHVTRTLQNAIVKGKIHHAFLFTGTRGVGKTTTARVLAKALNCTNSDSPTTTPCGECSACKAIAKGSDIDVNEIDGASNNSVNDVRDLRDNAQYSPQKSRYKIYIIDEVHMLSGAAFNALLKTLEEPPEHVKFIFATTESHKIPQTILSRCQRYDFKAVGAREIGELVTSLLEKENMEISEGALRMIARMARGSVRDGLSLTDSVLAYAGEGIDENDVRTVLGIADAAIFERIVQALIERDAEAVFSAVSDLVDYGHDLRQFGGEFLEYLRDALMLATNRSATEQIDRPEGEIKQLAKFSKQADAAEWIAWFDLMIEGQERIARSEQDRFMLELALAKMLQVGKLRSIDELLAGLGKLARSGGGLSGSGGSGRQSRPSGGRIERPARSDYQAHESVAVHPSSQESTDILAAPENWHDLVRQIMGKSRTMWDALRKSGLLEWTDDRIRIECPKNTRAWSEIGSPEGKRHLQQAITDLLKKNIRVEVVGCEQTNGNTISIADEQRAKLQRHKEEARQKGKKDPKVLEVLEVFGGGEVTVRPLEPKEQAKG